MNIFVPNWKSRWWTREHKGKLSNCSEIEFQNPIIQGDSYLLKQEEMTFFDGNGWFQVKTFLWWNLDHFNIFQSIYSHFLIWPTFDLKRAYGLQKAGIKKWSFGTHQKLVSIYKLMIEKLTNILQNEICHVKLSYLTAQKIFWT